MEDERRRKRENINKEWSCTNLWGPPLGNSWSNSCFTFLPHGYISRGGFPCH